jgi:valyl-tRNA synthetase
VRKELASVEAKLANEQFVNRAPAAVVEKQRAIRQELIDREGALARRRSDLPTREEGAA